MFSCVGLPPDRSTSVKPPTDSDYREFKGLYLCKRARRRRLRVTLNLSLPGKRLSPGNGGVSVGQENIESDSAVRNVRVTCKMDI